MDKMREWQMHCLFPISIDDPVYLSNVTYVTRYNEVIAVVDPPTIQMPLSR